MINMLIKLEITSTIEEKYAARGVLNSQISNSHKLFPYLIMDKFTIIIA